ncbi:unnamed protein product [Camellia sinensis]
MDVPSDHGRPFFLIINAWFAAFFGPASALIDTTSTKQGPHSIASLYHPKQLTRVNRELMGVIESLQHQNKKTEDNESSEETDCTCEKSDVVSGDAELCNVNSDILEEDEGKKARGGDCIYEKSLEKTDAVNDVDISSVKHEMSSNKKIKETAVDNKFKRTYKRKKPNDGNKATVGVKYSKKLNANSKKLNANSIKSQRISLDRFSPEKMGWPRSGFDSTLFQWVV